jgi:galactokinase
MQAKVADAHRKTFGREPEAISLAPARVNLIGEHTDYSGGFVFPAAIDRGIWVAAHVTEGPTRLHSDLLGDAKPFVAETVGIGEVTGFGAYPAGVASIIRLNGAIPNIEATIVSDAAMGAGLSSSAALELAFAVLWDHFAGLKLSREELATVAHRAENEYVGMRCGVMDQWASAFGKEGYAMLLDTRSMEIQYVKLPADLRVAVCDTGKSRDLASSSYNDRRKEVEAACKILGVRELRDANFDLLESHQSALGDILYRRAKHFLSETDRCLQFAEALNNDNRPSMGALMAGSHRSLRDDFEVSCLELDQMVEACLESPGCVGVRMMGGGFGGACIALVEAERIERFSEMALQKFHSIAVTRGTISGCRLASGAEVRYNMTR